MSKTREQHADTAGEVAWLTRQERGAVSGIRLVFLLARFLGRGPARLFLRVVALGYVLADKNARDASRGWLTRVHGRAASFGEVYDHILSFARVTLDRVFLLMGAHDAFTVNRTGSHHLAALAANKQGAVLVGAHLGSFEAMRAGAARERFPINIPRGERATALAAVVQRFAHRLEHYARMAPDNWFNFYDFWRQGEP